MQLEVLSAGPGVTIQDLGRPGWTAQGLSRGGAVDWHAVLAAAALLNAPTDFAVVEMMGFGGKFRADADTRIALTGAMMQAEINGSALPHQTTYILRAGQTLTVGGAAAGVFGYLAFAGGIAIPQIMGSRATHLTAGLGGPLQAGDLLQLGSDPDPLTPPRRLAMPGPATKPIRIMPGPQTDYFADETRLRFADTTFTRSPRGNRQGMRLDAETAPFTMSEPVNIVSDIVLPGDVQMTGDGVPYILLAECQTIGGYPRIGTVIPADLPKAAQVMPGQQIAFQWLDIAAADATYRSEAEMLRDLKAACQPLTRDPHDIADLLGYQLIGGVTRGDDLERP